MDNGRTSEAEDVLLASVNSELELLDVACRAGRTRGGLGLFATRDIPMGASVCVETPLVVAPYHDARPFVCASCLADSRCSHSTHGLPTRWTRRCKGCGTLRYCSVACEERHERHWGCECAALASIARYEREVMEPAVGAHSADLLAQAIHILADRQANRSVSVSAHCRLAYHDVAQRLVGVARGAVAAATIQQAVDAALHAVPHAARVPPPELFDVLSRLQANCHAVCGRGGATLARAACVGVLHLFNHSCAPNVAFDSVPLSWPEGEDQLGSQPSAEGMPPPAPAFRVVSLRPISTGEELFLSYVSTDEGGDERRAHLREAYGFDCACARCTAESAGGAAAAADKNQDDTACCYPPTARCERSDCGTGYCVAGRCLHCGRAPE